MPRTPLFGRLSLGQKAFAAMVSVFLIPTVAITWQSLSLSSEAVKSLQQDALNSEAFRADLEIRNWLHERVKDLVLWEEHRALLLHLAPEHRNHSHWRQDSNYLGLSIFDSQGRLLQEFGNHPGMDTLDRTHRLRLEGSDYGVLGELHPSHGQDSLRSIHLGVCLRDRGLVTGYHVVVLNTSRALRQLLVDGQHQSPYRFSVLNAQGTDLVGFLDEPDRQLPERLRQGTEQLTPFVGNGGQSRIGVSRPVDGPGWILVASADRQRTFAWMEVLKSRIGLTAASSLALVVLLGILLSMGIARPFNQILQFSTWVESKLAQTDQLPEPSFPTETVDRESAVVIRALQQMFTRLRASQIALRHQSTLAAVGELTSSVVHEFRNPLSSVKMNLQILQEQVRQTEPYGELCDIALRQTSKLERMLSELLSFGKPMAIHPESLGLEQIRLEFQTHLAPLLQGHSVLLELPPWPQGSIQADRDRLLGVFINIAENAVVAMEQKGRLRVECEARDRQVHWHFTDTGPGIPANLLPDIFRPFITSRDEGTGLGLAIAMKVVQLHGGRLSARNLPQGGAQFSITLPAQTIGTGEPQP